MLNNRAWNRDNPLPLTSGLRRALTVEFMKTYAMTSRIGQVKAHER